MDRNEGDLAILSVRTVCRLKFGGPANQSQMLLSPSSGKEEDQLVRLLIGLQLKINPVRDSSIPSQEINSPSHDSFFISPN